MVEPGQPAWKLIIGHFGVEVLLPDGHIDRPKLAKMIFEDDHKRHLLNICTHSYIRNAMLWEVVKYFLKGTYICSYRSIQVAHYVISVVTLLSAGYF